MGINHLDCFMDKLIYIKGGFLMRVIPIQYVKIGTKLGQSLQDDEGRVLLRAGMEITSKLKKRLNDFGIYSVYVDDGFSDVELQDVIQPKLRQKAIKTVKETFKSCMDFQEDINSPFKSKQIKAIDRRDEKIKSIESLSEEIIYDLLSSKQIALNLVDIKSRDEYIFQHSMNVAVLSLIIGAGAHLNVRDMKLLCTGAMLHDIGKTLIPKELVFKEGKLSLSELAIFKEHTSRGYDYLRDSREISAMARIIALQHHERLDGQGYPKGIKDIHNFAQIVAIANTYDNLTSDTPRHRAIPANEALEYIMGNAGTRFNINYVQYFKDRVVPYPIGTLIYLSNGNIAVVKRLNSGFPFRPLVQSVNSGKLLDLLKVTDLTITGVCYDLDSAGGE